MDLPSIYEIIGRAIPLACMKYHFMQHAFLGLLLLAPMASTMGVQVVNARMAFFSDAIGHSAFAGVALGIMLSIDPLWSMPLLGVAAGLGIVALQRRGKLSTDTAIGVSMSAVVAFGLAIISRDRHLARNMNSFLFGDILSINDTDILALAGLFSLLMAFQLWSYNRIALMTVNQIMAKTHGVSTRFYCYAQAALLSALVIFSVRAVGVFLVTAMLVVPAANGAYLRHKWLNEKNKG